MQESVIVEKLAKAYTIGRSASTTMLRERLRSVFLNPRGAARTRTETLWAIRDVSFVIPQGEVVGVIGGNGAGKSTLFKLLSKITYPTSGILRTRGRVASLLEVGTGFHDELTGRENVYLNGSILGMKKKEVDARFDDIVGFSGVEKFLDTPIKHYSSGMRLRLGFAVAAHLDPDVLLLDEVLAVGDAGFQKKCLTAVEGLRGSGRTVLFVSHNLAAIESLCSRVVWLEEGRARMDGDAADVIRSYMATFADKQSGADLRLMEPRQGTGEIRFTGLEFLTPERAPQPVTRTGDRLVIRFRYDAATAVPRPSVGFRLHTELGTLISSSSTWLHAIEIPLVPPGAGYVDVDLACVNLVPGRYSISVWMSDGPHGSHTYDALSHCARLDVEPSSFHGSARPIDSGYGIVYFAQTWDVRGTRASRPG
jgi:lipopolysaccharide transport system ATP-binding protein